MLSKTRFRGEKFETQVTFRQVHASVEQRAHLQKRTGTFQNVSRLGTATAESSLPVYAAACAFRRGHYSDEKFETQVIFRQVHASVEQRAHFQERIGTFQNVSRLGTATAESSLHVYAAACAFRRGHHS